MRSCVEQVLARIEQREGLIPWMYRDAAGQITVGAGVVLDDAERAAHLPFQVGARAATRAEITAEFRRVEQLDAGKPAAFYQKEGQPLLEVEVVEALMRTALVGAEDDLRALVRGYEALPDAARMSLLARGFHLERRRMLAAVPVERRQAIEDWSHASTVAVPAHAPDFTPNWPEIAAVVKGREDAELAIGTQEPTATRERPAAASAEVTRIELVRSSTEAALEIRAADQPDTRPPREQRSAAKAREESPPAQGRTPLREVGFGLVGLGAAALRWLRR